MVPSYIVDLFPPLVTNERVIFFEAVRDFQTLNIKLLLFGNDTLNNVSNTTLLRAVHGNMKTTKRFDTE